MPIKVLLTKIGIDGHDRGIKVLIYALRNAGMDVIYTGPWQDIDDVVTTAEQEDVNVIGVSTLGGDYLLVPKMIDALHQKDLKIPVIVGGIIPPDIEDELKYYGVDQIFHPGSDIDSIIESIESIAGKQTSS